LNIQKPVGGLVSGRVAVNGCSECRCAVINLTVKLTVN